MKYDVKFTREWDEDIEFATERFKGVPDLEALRRQLDLELKEVPGLRGTYTLADAVSLGNAGGEYVVDGIFESNLTQDKFCSLLQMGYDVFGVAGEFEILKATP